MVQKQIDVRAAKEGIEVAKAKFELLAEKQPSHEFCYPRAAWILCSVSLLRRRCTVSGAGECDRWGMDSTVERFCEVAMRNKITSAAEAVAIVQNGDAVCSSGFVGIGVPDALLVAFEKRFVEAGEPRDLTLLFAAGQGDGKSAASLRSAMRGY